jgi:hypothetical protein
MAIEVNKIIPFPLTKKLLEKGFDDSTQYFWTLDPDGDPHIFSEWESRKGKWDEDWYAYECGGMTILDACMWLLKKDIVVWHEPYQGEEYNKDTEIYEFVPFQYWKVLHRNVSATNIPVVFSVSPMDQLSQGYFKEIELALQLLP